MLRLVLTMASVLVIGPNSAAGAAGGGVPPVALSVSPARVELAAPASRTIELRNVGAEGMVVDVAPKSIDRSIRADAWLSVRPARLVLRSRSRAVITLRVRAHDGARPGDHQLRVLVVARPQRSSRVAVRVRLGVGVRVRMPGRLVRRVTVRAVRVRPHGPTRDLLVSVANCGNVTEQLGGRLTVTLVRRGRLVSRLRLRGPHELFPGAGTVIPLRYAGHVRGLVTAVVRVRFGGRLLLVERRYRLRL